MVLPGNSIGIFKVIVGVILAICLAGYVFTTFRGRKNKPKGAWVKDIVYMLIPIATIVILFRFIFCIGPITSGSMEPTLMTGDSAVYNRLAYMGDNEVQRGDIVVVWSDEFNEAVGKRVIGLPGDEISFVDGKVIINGQSLDESSYIPEGVDTNCDKTFKVPDGCYFLLGDNRKYSHDSRFWDNPYIPKKDIIGKHMISFPFSIEQDILHII